MISALFRTTIDSQTKEERVVPTGTVYSTPWNASMMTVNWAAQIAWTGTLSGTITLWYSNQPNPSLTDDTGWTQAPAGDFTAIATGGAAGSSVASGTKPFRWIRFKYTHTSGTGYLSGNVNQP